MPAIRSLQCSAPINSGIQRSAKGPRFQHHSAAMLHVETVEGHLENSHHLSCIDRAQRMLISGSWKMIFLSYVYTKFWPETSCTKEIHSTQVNVFVFFSFYNITCVRVYGGYLSFSLCKTFSFRVTQPREQALSINSKSEKGLGESDWNPGSTLGCQPTIQPHATIQQLPANKWTTPWHCIFIPIYLKGAACSIWMYQDSILKFHMVKPISFLSNEWHRCCLSLTACDFFQGKKNANGPCRWLNICIIPSIIQPIPKPMRGRIMCKSLCLIAKRCK